MYRSKQLIPTALILAAAAGCGGSSGGAPTESPSSPAPAPAVTTPSAAAAAHTPAYFPLGSWAKVKQQYHETLVFSDVPAVTFHDTRGQILDRITLPAAHEMTFPGDGHFCTSSGTYRYSVMKHKLHFTLVGADRCKARIDYLTGSQWRFEG